MIVPSLVLALSLHTADAADWRDDAPFSADPAALLQEAAEHDDVPVHQLYEGIRYTWLGEGKQLKHHHRVFVVHDPGSLDRWMTIEVPWSPEFEAQPVVQARVIGPDGTVRQLDPSATLVEGPDRPEGPDTVWRKLIRVVLPGPEVGAVVEVVTGHGSRVGLPPEAGLGTVQYYVPLAPTDVMRLQAVSTSPLRGEGGRVTTGKEGETYTATVELRDVETPDMDAFAPWISARFPVLTLGADRSDKAMAASATAAFAPHLETGPTLDSLTECAGDEATDAGKTGCLLDALHTRLDIFPVDAGSTNWLVRDRAEVLASGHARALEASLLFTAMARHVGLDAQLAFTEATTPPHPDPLPRWLAFHTHPLVEIDGQWFDVGQPGGGPDGLPSQAYERPALLLDGTRTTTPRNHSSADRTYTYDPMSGRHVSYESTVTGWVSQRFRGLWRRSEREPQVKDALEGAMRQAVGDDALETFELDDSLSHGTDAFHWGATSRRSTAILPAPFQTLLRPPSETAAGQLTGLAEGDYDIVFEDADVSERRLRLGRFRNTTRAVVKSPPDHELIDVPEAVSGQHGPLRYERSITESEGQFEVVVEVEVTEPTIRQADLQDAREAIADLGFGEQAWQLRHKALGPLSRSEVRAAVDMARTSVAEHPDDMYVQIAWATVLAQLGHPERSMELLEALADTHEGNPLPAFAMVSAIFDTPLDTGNEVVDESLARRFLELMDTTTAKDPTNPVFIGVRAYTAASMVQRHIHEPEVLAELYDPIVASIDLPGVRDETITEYVNILYALRRIDEMRERLSDYRFFGTTLPALAVAAITEESGVEAAQAMVRETMPAARFQAAPLAGGAIALLMQADYRNAATLARAAGEADPELPLGALPEFLEAMADLKPLKRNDPLLAMLDPGLGDKAASMFDDSPVPVPITPEMAQTLLLAGVRASSNPRVRGDKRAGWVVTVEPIESLEDMPFAAEPTWFAAWRGSKGWQFLGDPADTASIGAHVFDRLKAGDPHAARLLDTLHDEASSGEMALFSKLYEMLDLQDPRAQLTLAAALGANTRRPEILDQFEQGLDLLDGELRTQAQAVLVYYNTEIGRHDAVLRIAAAMPEDMGDDTWGPWALRAGALAEMGRHDEAIEILEQRLEQRPSSLIYDNLGLTLSRAGRIDEAIEVFEEGAELDEIHPNFYNNHAWTSLFAANTQEAAALAKLGLRRSGDDRAESLLHTYAAAAADLGRVDEAWEAFRNAKEHEGRLEAHWWYVVGRIAEQLDLPGEAEIAYRKVERDDGPVSTWKLAATRLKAMGKVP